MTSKSAKRFFEAMAQPTNNSPLPAIFDDAGNSDTAKDINGLLLYQKYLLNSFRNNQKIQSYTLVSESVFELTDSTKIFNSAEALYNHLMNAEKTRSDLKVIPMHNVKQLRSKVFNRAFERLKTYISHVLDYCIRYQELMLPVEGESWLAICQVLHDLSMRYKSCSCDKRLFSRAVFSITAISYTMMKNNDLKEKQIIENTDAPLLRCSKCKIAYFKDHADQKWNAVVHKYFCDIIMFDKKTDKELRRLVKKYMKITKNIKSSEIKK